MPVENTETVTLLVEEGALTECPIFSRNSGAKNWAAVVTRDRTAPGGLARRFLNRAQGLYYNLTDVARGDVLEFGADYMSRRHNRVYCRRYYVVSILTTRELILLRSSTHPDSEAHTLRIAAELDKAPLPFPATRTIKRRIITQEETV